jgi:exosortase/archaeosortase family protein
MWLAGTVDEVGTRFARLAVALPAAVVAMRVLGDPWRDAEAAVVAAIVDATGARASRSGSSIVVLDTRSVSFVLEVITACSSLPLVVALVVLGALPASWPRRWRDLLVAAAVAIGANLVRLGGVAMVGVWWGPVALDRVHDGVGVVWSLVIAGGIGSWLARRRRHALTAASPPDESPRVRPMRRNTSAARPAAASVTTSITVASAFSAGVDPARAPE